MFGPMMFMTPMMAGDAWIKLVSRMQVETVALMTRRTLAVMELPHALSRCETPQDVVAEQVRYWQIAQRQYMQGLEKVAAVVPGSIAQAAAQRRPRDYMVVADNTAAMATAAPAATVTAPVRVPPTRDAVRREPLPAYKKSA
jgi:hypothetical protein